MLPLSNKSLLRLTSQLYFTPTGHSIQGRGVIPDINYVPLKPPAEEPEYVKPIDNLPTDITFDNRLSTQTCSPVVNDPVRNTQDELMFVDGEVDYALVCAIETLRNEQRRTVRVPVLDAPAV
jgi:C-terminal processing protease CtpA/Prc